MENRKLRVAITHGDTNGIGYEIIFKTFSEPAMLELCTPIIYGSPKVAAYHRNALGIQGNFTIINSAADAHSNKLNLLTTFDEEVKVDLGKPSKEAGAASLKALDRAMADYKDGLFDVLVTAPINKNNIQSDDFHFCGHTEYIEERAGEGNKALMIMVNDMLRVALVTTHLPIRDVASAITKEKIIEKATIFYNSLKRDFRISNPRIAILALNPHAGDGGLLGKEEEEIIIPAINELSETAYVPSDLMLPTVSSVTRLTRHSTVYLPCITTRASLRLNVSTSATVSTILPDCPSCAHRPTMALLTTLPERTKPTRVLSEMPYISQWTYSATVLNTTSLLPIR